MPGNILGESFKIISFGESHGKCVGVVIEGCPAGLRVDLDKIQKEVDKRKPKDAALSTQRREEDRVEVLSGIFKGFTTGAPICMILFNKDVDSSKYEKIKDLPRPGHSDLTAYLKYKGFNDYRGGGRFSGRITAALVAAGALAKQILETKKIEVIAHTVQIGKIKAKRMGLEEIKKNKEKNFLKCADLEKAKEMESLIKKVREEGDSIGGIIEGIILNVPAGLGEPIFSNLDSDLAKALFAIGAVKGVEFGAGFKAAEMKGSENNDEFFAKEGRILTKTNNAGGILGGISNGMPITFRVAFKPTPSIFKPQKTVNLKTLKEETLKIEGRHDPCIVPRAVPVVEAMASMVIVDHLLQGGFLPPVLK